MLKTPAVLHLTNAWVVTPDAVQEKSSVTIRDGFIVAVGGNCPTGASEVDLGGQLLMPGIVDLHCDAIEKEVEPRPKVPFPLPFAVTQSDRRNAGAGITTIFHSISFASGELGVRNVATAGDLVRAIRAHNRHGLVDNRTHCRFEVTDGDAAPVISALIDEGAVDLLSLMDHSPGQGQFRKPEDYIAYLGRTYHIPEAEATVITERKLAGRAPAWERARELANTARTAGVPIASHDDDSPARVAEMIALGVSISEFPTDIETAHAARAAGISVLVGAPNALRGRSQGGHLRAEDALRAGAADCLCADYAPATMLPAALRLVDIGALDLPRAAAVIANNPARAAGLADRGRIIPGLRADLVAVDARPGRHHATATWVAGRLAYRNEYPT